MKLRMILSSVIAVITFHAQAGQEVGNGGDILICRDTATKAVTSMELYDYYEARVKQSLHVDLGSSDLSVDQKVELAISRLDVLNPSRAKLYRERAKEFWANTKVVTGVTLIDIPDTGDGYFPNNCEIKQLAVQREPKYPGDVWYTINGDIWNHAAMTNDSRAGLILHEIILREATSEHNHHTNSIATRYFHSMIAASKILSLTLEPYLKLLKLVGLGVADVNGTSGVNVDPRKPFGFYDSSHIRVAVTAPTNIRIVNDDGGWTSINETENDTVSFYQDGRVAAIVFDKNQDVYKTIDFGTIEYTGTLYDLMFFQNGRPKAFHRGNGSGRLLGSDYFFELSGPGVQMRPVEFFENGSLKIAPYITSGNWNGISVFQEIEFWSPGKLMNIYYAAPVAAQVLQQSVNLGGHVKFYASGSYEIVSFSSGTELKFKVQNKDFALFQKSGDMSFYEQGQIQSFAPDRVTKLKCEDGKFVTTEKGRYLKLNLDGFVINEDDVCR